MCVLRRICPYLISIKWTGNYKVMGEPKRSKAAVTTLPTNQLPLTCTTEVHAYLCKRRCYALSAIPSICNSCPDVKPFSRYGRCRQESLKERILSTYDRIF